MDGEELVAAILSAEIPDSYPNPESFHEALPLSGRAWAEAIAKTVRRHYEGRGAEGAPERVIRAIEMADAPNQLNRQDAEKFAKAAIAAMGHVPAVAVDDTKSPVSITNAGQSIQTSNVNLKALEEHLLIELDGAGSSSMVNKQRMRSIIRTAFKGAGV